jgi:DNA-binding transcriptional ArsR family regulator
MIMNDADKVFKALADASRRKLLDRLFDQNGRTLTELCAGLDMTRQAVTQHLAVLEDADLISVQWKGREKLHFINPVPIHAAYSRWIRKFEKPRLAALQEFKVTLEKESDPCKTSRPSSTLPTSPRRQRKSGAH